MLDEVKYAERMMEMEDVFLIRNAQVYAPDELGKRDVLVCAGKIMRIAEHIGLPEGFCQVMDVQGKYLFPGFIDQHVHVTGGGGEGGFSTRTPEIQLSELIRGGITTVVGLLGTDGTTRSVENLYAKTMALSEEGKSKSFNDEQPLKHWLPKEVIPSGLSTVCKAEHL